MSGIRLPDCFKLAINWKNINDVTTCPYDVIIYFFWLRFVFPVEFSYWSKFHVNIITDSGVMTVFFYKWLTGNPEIRNPSVWVFPNILQVKNIKSGAYVSHEVSLSAAKCQGYSFYRFWVIKGKPTGEVKVNPPLPLRLGLMNQIIIALLRLRKGNFRTEQKH